MNAPSIFDDHRLDGAGRIQQISAHWANYKCALEAHHVLRQPSLVEAMQRLGGLGWTRASYSAEGSRPTKRGREGLPPFRSRPSGDPLKAFGCIANLYCQAGVPRGTAGRRDAENRVREEA